MDVRKMESHRSDGKEERECCGTAEHVLRESGKEAARACATPLYGCVSADNGNEGGEKARKKSAYRRIL
jgi:hypothetical protein